MRRPPRTPQRSARRDGALRGRTSRLSTGRGASDRGFATVAVLALSSWLVLLAAVLVALGAVAVLRSHAAAAADEAALTAAAHSRDGSGPACARAASVAEAIGARLVGCHLGGDPSDVVDVEVSVPGPGVLARFGAATGRARAGPAHPGTAVWEPGGSSGASPAGRWPVVLP